MHSEAQALKTSTSNSASREKMRSALSGLCTADDVAKMLNMSRSSIRPLLNSRELPMLGKIGPLMVFLREDVEALKAKRDEWRKGRQNEHRV